MNPNPSSSSQDGKGTNLPSGPKPTFFITNKGTGELSDDELKILGRKVLEKIRGQDKSLSALCIGIDFAYASNIIQNTDYTEECPFCKSMNAQFQTKDDSTPKLFQKGGWDDSSGFRGCEQNNLIIHFDDAISYTYYECFSRARQNLIVIIGKSYLEGYLEDPIKEILTHEEKCKHQNCKENGLDKLKVVDVEYIGFSDNEVKQFFRFQKQ